MKTDQGIKFRARKQSLFAVVILFLLVLTGLSNIILAADSSTIGDIFIPEVEYTYYELENGLEIYVFEDHQVPMVNVGVWYKVGALYENKGITGISHALEHTMFLGTEALEKDQIHKIVKKVGGSNNASTGYSITRYYEQVPTNSMELAFAIEADRMRNLKFDTKEFNREKEVLMQERRKRIENDAFSSGHEIIKAEAFQMSPLRHEVCGWMEDLEGLNEEKVIEYYHEYYAPNNAVLVVSGDADPDQVLSMAERYFGDYEPVQVEKNIPLEPEQKEERLITVEKITRVPYIVMIYKTPVGNHPDNMAIQFLLITLVNKPDSRVNVELKMNKQILLAAGAGINQMPIPSYSEVILIPTSEALIPEVQAGFEEELKKLIENGVNEEEIEIIKKSVLKDLIFSQRDVTSFASSIVAGDIDYGDRDLYKKRIQQIKDITAEDIVRVAKEYFTEDNCTIGYIVPEKSGEGDK